MKNLFLFISVLFAVYVNAQTTCQTAQPFCAGGVSGVTFPATTGSTTAAPGPNYGCLGSQPNPAWYYLQIGNSGSLDILIQGVATSPPGPGQDVDFICWGPFSSLAGICNSLTAANTIDCSYSASFTETLNITSGISGQYYLVLITNFANVSQNILFSQFGGTGDTNCGLVTTNTTICQGGTVAITTNTPSGLSNVTYSLLPGNLTSNTPTFILTPTVTTSYSIYATGTNTSNGVITQSATSNVTVNPLPVAVPTITNSTCTSSLSSLNLGLSFIPVNASPSYTINWSTIPNGINTPVQTTVNGYINPGVYTATITAAGGCKAVTNFTVLPQPAPANFTLSPASSVYSITCYQPTVTITALNSSNSYTWMHTSAAPIYNSVADISLSGVGSWTCLSVNNTSGCRDSKTFIIGQNTVSPTAIVTPSFQNITCVLSTITTVTLVATPSVNVNQIVTAPNNATFSTNSYTAAYAPGAPGTYTYCVYDAINGCSVCKQFTVASSQGFPSCNVVSPQNFTLGCGTKSVATINITNGQTSPPGGGLLYGIISPTNPTTITNTIVPTFTVNVPGTYTMITKDITNSCENRVPVSVLSNTFGPSLDSVSVPQMALDCNTPKMIMQGFSKTPNTGYNWSFPGVPGNLPTSTISVQTNTAAPNNTVIANYTLTLTDNNNTCKTNTVITITQNLYAPKALINAATPSITCKTATIMLTNSSTTGIPPNSVFQPSIVVAYEWRGPSPQTPLQLSSTYVASTVGDYTMVAKDSGNGCTSQTIISIGDGRNYPAVNTPSAPAPFVLDCGSDNVKISPIISTPTTNLVYLWQLPQISAVTGVTNVVLTTTALGQYKILVTNTVNGCSSVGEVSVVNGALNADFEADSYSGFAPLTVNLKNLSASTTGTSLVNTVWQFGNGTFTTTPSASISPFTTFNMPGNYTITAFVNKGNCTQKVSKVIYVEIPSELIIPNIFTPNNDNINDVFFLKASNLSNIDLKIYDRWGHQVFYQISTTGNINWDGKNFDGKDVPDGTYFYILKAEGKDTKQFEKKGNITIVR